MTYTLAGIRGRVINEKLADDEFEPTIVDGFINDTQRDIFNQYELSFQEKIYKGTLPATLTIFKTPEDLALLQRLVLIYDDEVSDISNKYLPWRKFTEKYPDPINSQAKKVSNWTSYAGNIWFNCPTDKDQTLMMYYIRKPKLLSGDNDVPEVPEEFSELLILGAYMRCLEYNEDYDRAAYIRSQYNNQLDLLVNRYGARLSPGSVKMANQQIRMRRA